MSAEKQDKNINLQDRYNRFEDWTEKNKRPVSIGTGVILALVLGYLGYTKLYLAPQEDKAQSQMYVAQKYFEKDSLNLALNGDNNYPGFKGIIDKYGMTKAANLAHYYAGLIYLKQGKFQQAIDELDDFKASDMIISSMALGATGDAYSELNKYDDAISYYKKAAYKNDNSFSTPFYLQKAGMLLEMQKKYSDAKTLYQEIKDKYSDSIEGRDIDKYIARVDAEMGVTEK